MKSFAEFVKHDTLIKESRFSGLTYHVISLIEDKIKSHGFSLVDITPKKDYEDDESFRAEIWLGNTSKQRNTAILEIDSHVSSKPKELRKHKDKTKLIIKLDDNRIINEFDTPEAENGADFSDTVLNKIVKEVLYKLGVSIVS